MSACVQPVENSRFNVVSLGLGLLSRVSCCRAFQDPGCGWVTNPKLQRADLAEVRQFLSPLNLWLQQGGRAVDQAHFHPSPFHLNQGGTDCLHTPLGTLYLYSHPLSPRISLAVAGWGWCFMHRGWPFCPSGALWTESCTIVPILSCTFPQQIGTMMSGQLTRKTWSFCEQSSDSLLVGKVGFCWTRVKKTPILTCCHASSLQTWSNKDLSRSEQHISVQALHRFHSQLRFHLQNLGPSCSSICSGKSSLKTKSVAPFHFVAVTILVLHWW